FTHPVPTVIYTLSLHDALPIFAVFNVEIHTLDDIDSTERLGGVMKRKRSHGFPLFHCAESETAHQLALRDPSEDKYWRDGERGRSEEHTSELQSRENLVCRLLL